MKQIKTIAFYLAILILLIAGMSIDLSAGNKHSNRKQSRIYANRSASCRAEQLRIQTSSKTYKHKHHGR